MFLFLVETPMKQGGQPMLFMKTYLMPKMHVITYLASMFVIDISLFFTTNQTRYALFCYGFLLTSHLYSFHFAIAFILQAVYVLHFWEDFWQLENMTRNSKIHKRKMIMFIIFK